MSSSPSCLANTTLQSVLQVGSNLTELNQDMNTTVNNLVSKTKVLKTQIVGLCSLIWEQRDKIQKLQQSDVNVLKTQITGLRCLILDQSNNIQKLLQPYNQPAHRYNANCEYRHYQTPNHSTTDPVEEKRIKMMYYSLIYY